LDEPDPSGEFCTTPPLGKSPDALSVRPSGLRPIEMLDEVSTPIHGGGAAVNVAVTGREERAVLCTAWCVPGTARVLKSESNVMDFQTFGKS